MANIPKVIVTSREIRSEKVPEQALEFIRRYFQIVSQADFEKNPENHEDVFAIFHWTGESITRSWLDRLPNLKIIALSRAGYDHIDIKLVRQYGVKISNAPNSSATATADMAMALLLSAARNIVNEAEITRSAINKNISISDLSHEVTGSTLGIIGMGNIGYLIAKRAYGFDMKILYHNRKRRSVKEELTIGATYFAELENMLPHCDYLMIAACLNKKSKSLIGVKQLKLMKMSAILINVGRGEIVDHDALVDALKSGQIHAAALDVISETDHSTERQLLDLPNVIYTPHVASHVPSARLARINMAVQNLLAESKGERLPNELLQ